MHEWIAYLIVIITFMTGLILLILILGIDIQKRIGFKQTFIDGFRNLIGIILFVISVWILYKLLACISSFISKAFEIVFS